MIKYHVQYNYLNAFYNVNISLHNSASDPSRNVHALV